MLENNKRLTKMLYDDNISWIIFGVILLILFFTFRIVWVTSKRNDWMKLNFWDFKEHALSFSLMIVKFWVWDIIKLKR